MTDPACKVGDHGRCTCGDLCNVLGEVIEIEWSERKKDWWYKIKWSMGQGFTYDEIPGDSFEVTALTVFPDGICEIPL